MIHFKSWLLWLWEYANSHSVAVTLIGLIITGVTGTKFYKKIAHALSPVGMMSNDTLRAEIDQKKLYFTANDYVVMNSEDGEIMKTADLPPTKNKNASLIHFRDELLFDDQPCYLLVAATGVGKTTFLSNLYFSYKKKYFLKGKPRLLFGTMYDPATLKKIDDLIEKDKAAQTILVLDAMDEFTPFPMTGPDATEEKYWDNYWFEFNSNWIELAKKIPLFKKVIISVREQFLQYRNVEAIMFKRGTRSLQLRKIKLSPFDSTTKRADYLKVRFKVPHRINRFLTPQRRKAYHFKKERFEGIGKLIEDRVERKYQLDLFELPLVLNYMEYLWAGYMTDPRPGGYFKPFNIYTLITKGWLQREMETRGLTTAELTEISKFCEQLALTIASSNTYHISEEQLPELEKSLTVFLKGLGQRSLLIREKIQQKIYYRFAHKNFLEFFLVSYALADVSLLKGKHRDKAIPFNNYYFALQLLVGERWNRAKEKIPTSFRLAAESNSFVPLKASGSAPGTPTLKDAVSLIDGLVHNETGRRLLTGPAKNPELYVNFLEEILSEDDQESGNQGYGTWRSYFRAFRALTIQTNNFFDDKYINADPIATSFIRYFKFLITAIDFDDVSLRDHHLEIFSGIRSLKRIAITNTLIKGTTLNCFNECADLNDLDLSGNKIQDRGLETLQSFENLRSLKLNDNFLHGSSLRIFTPSASELTVLCLGGNVLNDGALKYFAGTNQLTYLDLSKNRLNGSGLKNFSGNVRTLQVLNLHSNLITDKPLQSFEGVVQLKKLSLSKNQLTGSGLKYFAQSARTLELLSLFKNEISDDQLKFFEACDSLEVLLLKNNKLKGDCLQYFQKSMPRLRLLTLSGNRISDDYLRLLKPCRYLERLYIGNNRISQFGDSLNDIIPNLIELGIEGNLFLKDSLKLFRNAKNLRTLAIGYPAEELNDLLSYFKNSSLLEELFVGPFTTIESGKFLDLFPKLEQLTVTDCDFSDYEAFLEKLGSKKIQMSGHYPEEHPMFDIHKIDIKGNN